MVRFFIDTVCGAVVITIATLVVFVLLPSGKLDIENVAFAILFGIVWGVPLGVVYAVIRRIVRGASR